ncbi:GH36-type glycosyl hydrolase domain-containing protein [Bacillus sp. T33-2]|uniref:GH36-type glycosyl hydrolase domain-containing protein n=1 Tax=Bacillus sp. T33-2 TaxID=2054168 RepID=UPI000C775C8A|nr:cellobiose phosphorylase [Bacillus sp. T33-2]PLR99081.1 cellobiose phosphorylase [Bacillus sp. T33-2]
MLKLQNPTIQLQAGDLSFKFLNSGDISIITYKNIMLNQVMTNPIDGSLNNLYLRLYKNEGIKVVPLLGIHSESTLHYSDSHVSWQGSADEVRYKVDFMLSDKGIWFWDINLDGNGIEADIIYGQDLGLADTSAVRSNEAYMAQYIDHTVLEDEFKGYIVCSRQNQPQSVGFPYLQQGSLTKTVGFSTDGFQFFGLSYKETNKPEVLTKSSLANKVYQYEFAYTALQSEKIKLSGQAQFVFYGLFKSDHPEAITALEFQDDIRSAWAEVKGTKKECNPIEKPVISPQIGEPLKTLSFDQDEIDCLFQNRHQEEWDGGKLLSFFTDTYEHIVLKEKELLVERPTGHIIMTGQTGKMKENTITTTNYMYGVFNAQLVVGNTSMNKLLTNVRNPLNILKTSGQRIYVEIEGVYQLFTMPSLFEMGFNYARWYYKTSGETFIITNFTTVDSPEVQLNVRSLSGNFYRYLVTNQVSMNNNEYAVPFHIDHQSQTLTFRADSNSDNARAYPNLSYRMKIEGTDFTVDDERKFGNNLIPQSASIVVLELSAAPEWEMTVQGLLHGEEIPFVQREASTEIENYRNVYRKVMNGFQLSQKEKTTDELEKVNALAWWYTHNMLIHYSVPHGLEQYSGAAWGTRDVCQGPTEYFMATQNYDAVRDIIKTVFSHQYEETGNWPQWFMFDNYINIQAHESHGDIIVWPLKMLTDYIAATNDFSILQEKVPYTTTKTYQFTENTATILEHAKKEIAYIKDNFLHGTHLSSYGDGDWDDTLQPANAQLKKYMISSWTVSLTYQVLNHLSKVMGKVDENEAVELKQLASGIENDFNKYILQTEVIPGFVYMENPETAELMLHPEDTKTGINYRLLPMTRSMISELFTPEQAETHYQIIKEKLLCPDGVRLMNRPAKYIGGVSAHFKRAEQAANFGREIGLQYVHAHIRFVEAMAKLGKVDEVWNGLQVINPIGIKQVVPNAEIRQSNTYFSSSDGKFNSRYEAQERFDELRNGTVPVKGGWRIYSSGPGIYMNQLISNCLGIRFHETDLVIDPVLPQSFGELRFNFEIMGAPVTFVYHLDNQSEKRVLINGQITDAESISNRYRQGGLRINRQQLDQNLTKDTNIIEVYL